ncbi:MAG: tRNA pseudouridine(38-40) synthase TruA [Candidatus Thorarchaeota archaeon]
MQSYVCKLFYLGGDYYGSQWQIGQKTVQGELITALNEFTKNEYSPSTVLFSGRTDKGVHSLGQNVMFSTEKQLNIDKVNRYLPDDIILWSSTQAPPNFNPRYDVLMRHYRYYLDTRDIDIDIRKVREAADLLVGTNEYKLISKPDGDRVTKATILNIFASERSDSLVLDVFGASFLWRLVRKITTLLTKVGAGELPVKTVSELLAGQNVIASGLRPAHPECLFLIDAVVPFKLMTSKNALSRIRKILKERIMFYTRSVIALSGFSEDFISNETRRF